MPKRTDISSILVIGAGRSPSHPSGGEGRGEGGYGAVVRCVAIGAATAPRSRLRFARHPLPLKGVRGFGAGAALVLAACATVPKVHSMRELASVADRCDVAAHELAQHRERPEIFYFLKPAASEPQLICVVRWAKKNHLKLVYVEGVEQQAER